MTLSLPQFLSASFLLFTAILTSNAQDLRRDLGLAEGASLSVTNRHGRVTVTTGDGSSALVARSPKGVADSEVSLNGSSISVSTSTDGKRIDLVLVVPKRSKLKIETESGAIDVAGEITEVTAKTDTGTIALDVPLDDLRYKFEWTESRPRYLADIELEKVRERSAGRFEISGFHKAEVVVPKTAAEPDAKPVVHSVSLKLSTARGIILLNVPENEVTSDLRERPLTNAAKAIIKSGDSLLMEAIRRAAPKYFGDYARSLPPLRLEPTFTASKPRVDVPNADVKTAFVRVTDLKNRAIPGLKAADFEVVEDGKRRDVISIERSEAPFNLVLLLDVSGSVENYVDFIRKAARSFVDTVGREDRVAIVTFNEDVKLLSSFTTDKGKLSESLDTFDAGGGTAYYDALAYSVADTLRPLRGGRTAIVILTDGDDNRSFLSFDSLTGSIQESGALIYPLYVPSGLIAMGSQSNADIDPLRKKYMSLSAKSEGEGERLAQISGGVYYPIRQIGEIQKAYEDIVTQMRSAYKVTFRSSRREVGEGSSPKLKIRVNKDDVFTAITNVTAVP